MESFKCSIVLCCLMTIFLLSNLSSIECQGGSNLEPFVRYNLTFRIVVKYPESKLTAQGLATDLKIVGNGLGLSWSQPTPLTKDGSSSNTWSIDLSFNSTSDGFVCFACSDSTMIPMGNNFEYRILTSNDQDMIGANFGLSLLPMSKTGSIFAIPNYFAYPYFFTRTGSLTNVNVTSSDPFIGTREWCYYLPASFQENTHKNTYPVAIALDMSEIYLTIIKAYLEQEVIEKGLAEELVIIGSGDYHPYIPGYPDETDRMELLTQVPGAGFACKNGSYANQCNGCIPPNLPNREFTEIMRDKCGVNVTIGGKGDSYLDHAIKEVLPRIQTLTGNRILIDRKHLGIGGCSLGGLLTCHALWTRPEVFGFGSCLSASFFWPMEDHVTLNNGFEFLNKTLKTQTGLRLPQNIYIDVSDGEDDPYNDQVGAALKAYETMATVSPDSFTADENLRFVLAQGQNHCDESTFGRVWLWLSPFIRPAGQPKNPYSPPTNAASKSTFKSSTSVGLVTQLLILNVIIQLAFVQKK